MTLFLFPFYTKSLNPSLLLSIIYSVNPSNPVPIRNNPFPISYKHALITPLLKKLNIDPHSLINYRPISNLSIFSKTLERIIAKQLTSYLISHTISHIFQSAYLPSKSIETSLAKISSDFSLILITKMAQYSHYLISPLHLTLLTTRFSYTVLHL